MVSFQMISPTLFVQDSADNLHVVFGWCVHDNGFIDPIVGNPDGPGVGLWTLYFGDDPWRTV